MKLKKCCILTEGAGDAVAVPVEETAEQFHGIIRLNATAVDIWHGLEEGKTAEEIAALLVETYDGIDIEKALSDTNAILEQFKKEGIIE